MPNDATILFRRALENTPSPYLNSLLHMRCLQNRNEPKPGGYYLTFNEETLLTLLKTLVWDPYRPATRLREGQQALMARNFGGKQGMMQIAFLPEGEVVSFRSVSATEVEAVWNARKEYYSLYDYTVAIITKAVDGAPVLQTFMPGDFADHIALPRMQQCERCAEEPQPNCGSCGNTGKFDLLQRVYNRQAAEKVGVEWVRVL